MSKQILITGGAGFVGSHLADGLLRAGHRVRVLDELNPQVHPGGRPDYLAKEVELLTGDMRDPNRLREAMTGVDVVFHFAACVGVGQSMYEISRYMSVNTIGTAELLQSILDSRSMVEKIVVASSMSIYGEGRYVCSQCGRHASPPVRPVEQLKAGHWDMHCEECGGVLKPVPTDESKPSEINSVYALSKRDQEELCLIYGRTYGLPVTALRFFNIYGTRQALSNPYTGVAAVFASRMLNGKQPLIFEDGEQMRDFVHVSDIVRANMLAMERPASNGQVINIGCGKPITIREVAEKLARSLGKDVLPVITNKYRAGDIRHCYADISKARVLLGYEPQMTHEEGFRELAEWLGEQQAEDKVETMLSELSAYGLTA
ncbi:NAD-dependent epimerase/dehydratase family protein [Occallatibacter riparius]|uniref:NAD-dependent epimerase/dehydratase family protein n=1 Tax=Occallatibacter riparius TaxID=1002689 RepID=A0A9J7BW59_9BACT|nr:NAD-dependent epimerase/dehydratase family protein [Occallatibacter riparius]UWZ86943.1 NAD-dependent epimerase/dehydratase family protein [Occallatibacter riparius]